MLKFRQAFHVPHPTHRQHRPIGVGARSDADADGDPMQRYRSVRSRTEALATPLSAEDMVVQSMPDASPTKWHLAHTAWFFETFVLIPGHANYPVFDPGYGYLFNSYYNAVGPRHPRPRRGLITRPAVSEVLAYRQHVDRHMHSLFLSGDAQRWKPLVELGMAHEQQHQELMLMDILHLFAQSSLHPSYFATNRPAAGAPPSHRFTRVEGGLVRIGHDGKDFAFDNEGPRHKVWLEPFEIAEHLVTNGEWIAFMDDRGYRRPELWLSDGWDRVQSEDWHAPLYWERTQDGWSHMTLHGLQPVDRHAAVRHVSYFEARAFADWSGARLPTEAEWELAARQGVLADWRGVAWQWTQSSYGPYPSFRPAAGAVGEYNGKFMAGQMVLRGGSDATPEGHTRFTYRNFYRPEQRWMFAGLRLARDAG